MIINKGGTYTLILILISFLSFGQYRITNGGFYTGDFTQGIDIQTTEHVIITDSYISGTGQLIKSIPGTDVEFYNNNIKGTTNNRFFRCDNIKRFVMENCELESSSGIKLIALNGAQEIRIRYNKVKNIQGLIVGTTKYWAQFVQLDQVIGVRCEIAWNYVENEPFKSYVEDNISTYGSRGYSNNPIKIHDNLIYGGYPPDPVNDSYSGGGILLGDYLSPNSNDPNKCSAYIEAFNNVVLNTTNYGVAISGGKSHRAYNNLILNTGTLQDGRQVKASNVGLYVWNGGKSIIFEDNRAYGNQIGWIKTTYRNDYWLPNCQNSCSNVTYKPGSIIRDSDIQTAINDWLKRVEQNGLTIGLKESTPPELEPDSLRVVEENFEIKKDTCYTYTEQWKRVYYILDSTYVVSDTVKTETIKIE